MTPQPSPRGSEELAVRTNPNSPPRTPRSALDAIEGGAPPSSARAVLEALRALQRKIVRLETERSSALREATELRHRFEGQSAASERASELQSRQLEDLERSFQLRESRLVRDRDDLTRRLDDAERDKLDALRCAYDECGSGLGVLCEVQGHAARRCVHCGKSWVDGDE